MSTTLPHDWYQAAVPANVQLGDRTWLYSSFAFLHFRSTRELGLVVGADSGLYNGTFFEIGPDGEVHIGEFCSVVGAIICTNRKVLIGDYVFIAHEVVIADLDAAVPLSWKRHEADVPAIVIGDNAWVGARATLLADCRIGEGAIVGAGAVVRGNVPPYSIVAGNPAAVVGWARPSDDARGA